MVSNFGTNWNGLFLAQCKNWVVSFPKSVHTELLEEPSALYLFFFLYVCDD